MDVTLPLTNKNYREDFMSKYFQDKKVNRFVDVTRDSKPEILKSVPGTRFIYNGDRDS